MSSHLTIPTTAENGDQAHFMTDFAIALGAYCEHFDEEYDGRTGKVGTINLREAGNFSGPKTFHSTGDEYSLAGIRKICVAPRIKNAVLTDYSVMENGPYKILTNKNGGVFLYPRTKITPAQDVLTELLHKGAIKKVGEFSSDSFVGDFDRSNMDIPYTRIGHDAYYHNGEIFVRIKSTVTCGIADNSIFQNGEQNVAGQSAWIKCEPIRAHYDGGDIQIDEALAPIIFDKQTKYEDEKHQKGEELDPKGREIGRFLEDLERDIINSIDMSKGIATASCGPAIPPSGTFAAAEHDKKRSRLAGDRSFQIGDRVKITCEGRTGTIRAIGNGVATLAVDGAKPGAALKYRLDDLCREDDAK